MHLADAFIQSDLQYIQVTGFTCLSALALPGNRTHDLGVASAMLYYLSYRKAINKTYKHNMFPKYIPVCMCIYFIHNAVFPHCYLFVLNLASCSFPLSFSAMFALFQRSHLHALTCKTPRQVSVKS